MNILIFGPNGSGKGTQGALLMEKYGIAHIESGAIFRKHIGGGTELGMKAKRILEINVDHAAFAALENARVNDPEKAKKYAAVLLNQAKLIAGLPIDDPSGYTDLLCSLWS